MSEPVWLEVARSCVGQREVPGPSSNGWIRSLWMGLRGGAWFWQHYGEDDTQLPWCGAFVAHCVAAAGVDYPARYASALAWSGWGEAVPGPVHGAVAVLTRNGGGHVGFVTGVSKDGKKVRLLGGNQNDQVCEAWFDTGRVTAYRVPPGHRAPRTAVAEVGSMSRSEA